MTMPGSSPSSSTMAALAPEKGLYATTPEDKELSDALEKPADEFEEDEDEALGNIGIGVQRPKGLAPSATSR